MGRYVRCGRCGTEVYTTGTRFPPHVDDQQNRCDYEHGADEPEEYEVGFDDEPWVFNGGLPELGKDR